MIKDVIADAFLQQILTRPREYGVIATPNLNGDYISDALAAQVGGIGIAPGANINYQTGHAIFEATHGTAPRYAGQDKVNPGSVILSGEMMFRHLGWDEAADLIIRGAGAHDRTATGDLRLRAPDAGRHAAQDVGVREGDGREHGRLTVSRLPFSSFPSFQSLDLPPIPLRRPPLFGDESRVQALELNRHRLPRGAALGALFVELRRLAAGPRRTRAPGR